MVCPTPQFQKESEKEVRFLVNPFGLFPPFAGAPLGCNSVNYKFTVYCGSFDMSGFIDKL